MTTNNADRDQALREYAENLLRKTDFELLACELQAALAAYSREPAKGERSVDALARATKIIEDVAQSAWERRIIKALLVKVPRGLTRTPARGGRRADPADDADIVVARLMHRLVHPTATDREFIIWHRGACGLPALDESQIKAALDSLRRARQRHKGRMRREIDPNDPLTRLLD